MDSTISKPLTASQARSLAQSAQEANYEKVLKVISDRAKYGREDTLLFDHINLEGAKRLMEMGYSVTLIEHPHELTKLYKVSW
jgi:predicted metal-dependent TIM-barrel fold hydrolase